MNEELLNYGKNNLHVSPELEIWGFPISFYLFLGGFAAGILFFTSMLFLITKNEKLLYRFQKVSQLASAALVVGIFALLFDLHKIFNSWRLYTHFDVEAPMSWGAWVLLAIIPLAFLWSFPYEWRMLGSSKLLEKVGSWVQTNRFGLAIVIAPLAIALGLYTGMLLSAFVSRPLWNSPLIPPLFLISGLSAGLAGLIWLGQDIKIKKTFLKVDIVLIAIEMILFISYIILLFSGSDAQIIAVKNILAGSHGFAFWIFVVIIGLILPLFVEWKQLRGIRIPHFIAPLMIITGSLAFRMIIVEAGQLLSL